MTAMMEQYFSIKEQHREALLLFRLGDFYELFFEDAKTASRELDIALTGRSYGEAERAPMCGVPYHAADTYIARLVKKGYHVAICEQMGPPKAKGLVDREVVRIITPGTITDTNMLEEGKNNYIVCLHCVKHQSKEFCTLSATDITTGNFIVTFFLSTELRIVDEVARFYPAELLVAENFPFIATLENTFDIKPTTMPMWAFGHDFAYKSLTTHFKTMHLEAFGIEKNSPVIPVAGALFTYLKETQKNTLGQICKITLHEENNFLILDRVARQNLELTAPLRPWLGSKKTNTLLGVLDCACTATGARLLRTWIDAPLNDVNAINDRLNAVEEWVFNSFTRAELRDLLKNMHDMERIATKLLGTSANATDMNRLKDSLAVLPIVKSKLANATATINVKMHENFDEMQDIYNLIDRAILEDSTSREGGVINPDYNSELNELIDMKKNGERWLAKLEEDERNITGIKSLKIRYNRVFGYFIEITKSNLNAVPINYVRKQTLAGSERYTTSELDLLAEQILTADEKRINLEQALFEDLRQKITAEIERIQFMAMLIASLDVLLALADVAERNMYIKPEVDDSGVINIKSGRHPVVEQIAPFVPNDTHLDTKKERISLITGPNMAGKSTYMRQVALIVIMAQIGSFVPAERAQIGVVDRIFTRIGASDDLAGGQSTFMVEMTEVAHILNNATSKSLIVMDEIGRGTSTYDGLSIAWSVLEYIEKFIKVKTLFATHYHELIAIEQNFPGILNYSFTLTDENEVVFLRKIVRGGADKSYGIQVAKLAGLPELVLTRAREVLKNLEI
ncbi:MAG: DNA mismatch repair protein MutS [Turicibacter sp.]|nr:DNA mismatch repair protein MutS [Turicibacter sp.]